MLRPSPQYGSLPAERHAEHLQTSNITPLRAHAVLDRLAQFPGVVAFLDMDS